MHSLPDTTRAPLPPLLAAFLLATTACAEGSLDDNPDATAGPSYTSCSAPRCEEQLEVCWCLEPEPRDCKTDEYCVVHRGSDTFCTADCTTDADCPDGACRTGYQGEQSYCVPFSQTDRIDSTCRRRQSSP